MSKSIDKLDSATLPNTCQYVVPSDRGNFLVQIAWPLSWSEKGVPPEEAPEEGEPPQTFFLVDGNAYFYTAVDVTRRMEYLNRTRTVVVGVGYPNKTAVYDYRRGPDLTPASLDGEYEMPLDRNGNPRTDISFGKALEFFQILQKDVIAHIYHNLLPIPALIEGRKALFGHSYGGIFTLYVLFTAPHIFDTVIAASPITWWNKSFLTHVLERQFHARDAVLQPAPSLFLTWGLNQHECHQKPGESADAYKRRFGIAEDPQMKETVMAMASRLKDSQKLRSITMHEFVDEDHGSSAVTSLQMGIMKFVRNEI